MTYRQTLNQHKKYSCRNNKFKKKKTTPPPEFCWFFPHLSPILTCKTFRIFPGSDRQGPAARRRRWSSNRRSSKKRCVPPDVAAMATATSSSSWHRDSAPGGEGPDAGGKWRMAPCIDSHYGALKIFGTSKLGRWVTSCSISINFHIKRIFFQVQFWGHPHFATNPKKVTARLLGEELRKVLSSGRRAWRRPTKACTPPTTWQRCDDTNRNAGNDQHT